MDNWISNFLVFAHLKMRLCIEEVEQFSVDTVSIVKVSGQQDKFYILSAIFAVSIQYVSAFCM